MRVVPNKYPAVSTAPSTAHAPIADAHRGPTGLNPWFSMKRVDAVGFHEVLIESASGSAQTRTCCLVTLCADPNLLLHLQHTVQTHSASLPPTVPSPTATRPSTLTALQPSHNVPTALASVKHVQGVVRALRDRGRSMLDSDATLRHIMYFKNSGLKAGASLLHPHSQILGLPIVPNDVVRRQRHAVSMQRLRPGLAALAPKPTRSAPCVHALPPCATCKQASRGECTDESNSEPAVYVCMCVCVCVCVCVWTAPVVPTVPPERLPGHTRRVLEGARRSRCQCQQQPMLT